MTLPFIYPWFLTGLFAAAIPIIIHLIYRRRFQPVRWAAMKFLLAAYKRNKTSLLLEHLLLLLLRILLIVLLVLIFARPVAKEVNLVGARTTRHYIIVFDNSYSMGVRDNNVSPFEKARREIRALLKQAESKDSITLITMNEFPKVLLSFATISSQTRRNEIAQTIEKIPLSHLGTNVVETINLLKQQTEKEKYLNKYVYIFTDCQKKPWQKASKDQEVLNTLKKMQSKIVSMHLVDVGVTSEPKNLTVTDLDTDGIVGIGIQSRFIATVQNYGTDNAENVVVDFFVDGNKQDPEFISIAAGEQQQVAFYYTFAETGSHAVTVKVGTDKLETDNQRHLAFEVVENIKVLAIDGDVKESAFESETDYLMAAIGEDVSSLIQARAVSIGDLLPDIRFEDYDVVILANLTTFSDEQRFQELQDFVDKGGGLYITLGEKVDPDYYNRNFFPQVLPFMPLRIDGGAIGRAEEDLDEGEDKTVFLFGKIDLDHPAFKYFQEYRRLGEDLYKCLTYKFFPIDKGKDFQSELVQKENPETRSNAISVLATYDDPGRHPAILECRYGRGKVLLFTSTADRAWNNLTSDQFGHVFLVMVHEFIQYLVARPRSEHNVRVGVPLVQRFFYYPGSEAQMVPPQGSPIKIGITDKPPYKIEFPDTSHAGVYSLQLDIPKQIFDEEPEARNDHVFAVNVDPREGDIERASRQDLADDFQSVKLRYTKTVKQTQKQGKEQAENTEYWKPILIILLVLCGIETFIAMWFGRYNK